MYMKNNNTNIQNKAIALLFVFQSYTAQSMEMPSYLMQFNKGTGVNYDKNCEKIDKYIKQLGILNFYCTNTNNKAEKINSIQKQFEEIGTKLLAAEQQALLGIKTKYNISNEIWQKYTADVHRMKTIHTKNMKKAHQNIIHDPTIPANILETLIALLQQNGINPQSIHIKMVTDQKIIDENPHTIAQVKNCVYFTISNKSEQNFITYNYQSPTIELFPRMTKKTSISDIIGTCAHEIQHLIQNHTLTTNILIAYLNHYYNIQENEFEKSSEYHKLSQIHEAQAEILSAIKNPKIAECLKIKRQKMYYPDHLYEEHFFHLASIDMLWKTHTMLKACQTHTTLLNQSSF